MSAPRKAKDKEAPTVHGPKIPGAQKRPTIGKVKPLDATPPSRKKNAYAPKKKPKDEVERSERYVDQARKGPMSMHQIKMRKIQRLKELIEPVTPSLIQVMSDIAHDKKVHPAVRLDAADRLLNRLYGKPTEKLELSEPEEAGNQDEVKTLLNNILESVGAPLLEFHDDENGPSQERNAPGSSEGDE